MRKPVNTTRPAWTQAEMNALVMLYRAGWRWDAIAAHVSGIHGNRRTYRACQSRGDYLGILKAERKGHGLIDKYDADICDLMLLDYSSFEITEEINRQYGTQHSQYYIFTRIRAQGRRYEAWTRRSSKRMGRCIKKARAKRRMAA